MSTSFVRLLSRCLPLILAGVAHAATTTLADSPVLATNQVPPNIMLTLSVEWPTGTVAAFNDNASTSTGYECPGRDAGIGVCYVSSRTYQGYFDSEKCYTYDTTTAYFVPKAYAATGRSCLLKTGRWSGNYLNWTSAHAIDGFRFAMTGGDRYIDTATTTVLEKSIHTGQGGSNQFPVKRVRDTDYTGGTPTVVAVAPSTVSPQSSSTQYSRVSNNAYQLAVGTTRAGRVVQFANNTAFLNNFTGSKVQYVKVQLSDTDILSLAEVQVFQTSSSGFTQCAVENATCTITAGSEVRYGNTGAWTTPRVFITSTPCTNAVFGDPLPSGAKVCQYRTLTNVAQAKTATQSSTTGGAGASRAVDNNTNGVLANNSVTQTQSESQPWWQVDLGGQYDIRAIVIYNRTDAYTTRLENFYVFAGLSDMQNKSVETALGDASIWKNQVGTPPAPSVVMAPQDTDTATDFLNVRVKVCDSTVGLELNCVAYGSSNKPTGIVQDNADKMRFGVAAYLNVDGQNTMGGVIRSKMKYVGPNTIVPNGTPLDNTRKEITTEGLLVADPEGVVAGEYKSSGAINYLNKFGKVGTKATLKGNDTASEMFYEALRYMRGETAATSAFYQYAGAETPAGRDGFPIYTDWTTTTSIDTKPIQYACQKTYFVGIGDTNTWCDSWGPGNTRTSSCSTSGVGHNAVAPADTVLNAITSGSNTGVMALDDLVGTNEGLGALGSSWVAAPRGDTYDIAGYAFWANTHDISTTLTGKQTAQTYWVDVRETGSFNGVTVPKNQYWLAGKYGGFPSAQPTTDNPQEYPAASYDPLGKNYFTGERPDLLISALKSVFKGILAVQQSNASASLTSNNLSSPGAAYLVRFNSSDWTGEIIGQTVAFTTSGAFTATEQWRSSALIDAQDADTGRKIVTWNPTSTRGVPFRYNAVTSTTTMSAAQQGFFGALATEQSDLINYLRGNRTYETGTSAKYRVRTHVLGDIVNGAPLVVGPPADTFSDAKNPGYSTFQSTYANRNKVLLVGANDGMLHAIDARVDSAVSPRGTELFAYAPSFAVSGPSASPTAATAAIDGMASRANTTLTHKYLVDGTMNVRSVDLSNTSGSSGAPAWRTLVAGGLGKGGRGFYALDMTDPSSWSSETAVASKVLWEYTDSDMGYSYGMPVITKTAQYGWVVIVTSGYNNPSGIGWIAILNARTGALLQKISTGTGTSASPAGLAHIEIFAQDRADFTAESVYAGDLLGNVWRFDLTALTGTYPTPTKIATLTTGGSLATAQAITTPPSVGVARDTLERWIFVGTGKLLATTDFANTQQQTYYALKDGLQTRFATTKADGSALPIDRAALDTVSDAQLLTGITVATGQSGWYHEFTGTAGNGATERLVTKADANSSLVAFSTQTPSTDPCSPGVSSRIYVLNYATGKSSLLNDSGSQVPYISSTDTVFGATLVTDSSGRIQLLVTNTTPTLSPPGSVAQTALGPPVKLNWREILQ